MRPIVGDIVQPSDPTFRPGGGGGTCAKAGDTSEKRIADVMSNDLCLNMTDYFLPVYCGG